MNTIGIKHEYLLIKLNKFHIVLSFGREVLYTAYPACMGLVYGTFHKKLDDERRSNRRPIDGRTVYGHRAYNIRTPVGRQLHGS